MCGIAGYAGLERGRERCAAELTAMCDAIRHRGPDDAGYFIAPGETPPVALGMRRLSIIDLAGGHQPIGNEDGSIQIVFNGEVYNYQALQGELRRRGHRLATHTDTETIVHLYEEHGDRVVDHLRGMFAFALWDGRKGRLLAARDRLGKKPLYYWPHRGGVAFASELKSLLALPGFPRRVDRSALADYLALGYVPEPASIFEGVRKLEPGHVLTWDRERGVETRRYSGRRSRRCGGC
jgi:asparagine synthase (glutamine-hydrolysing)